MKAIVFIPARGGSKSIPKKNIKDFCGKPLIYWNVKAAVEVARIAKVIVSTDSEEIKSVVQAFGLDKVEVYDRSSENAQDHSSTEAAMLEYIAAAQLDGDICFVLMQATSPFTSAKDLEAGLDLIQKEEVDSVLSCAVNKRFFWDAQGKPINYDPMARPRRQEFDGQWMENGAIYISRVDEIRHSQNRLSGRVAILKMPAHTSLELDEPIDWIIGEKIMEAYLK